MKYKVGDKVKVRKDLEAGTSYGGYTYVSDMAINCVTICYENSRSKSYMVEENSFTYTEEMFEDINIAESEPKMNLRLEIASRLLAGNLQGWEQTYEVGELLCKYYLSMADTLIKLEEETR